MARSVEEAGAFSRPGARAPVRQAARGLFNRGLTITVSTGRAIARDLPCLKAL